MPFGGGMHTHRTDATPIGVYLLVENRLVRESFMRLFRKRAGLAVVGQSQSCGAAMQELADKPCDVSLPSSVEHAPDDRGERERSGPTARPTPLLFGMEESSESFLRAVQRGACG